MAGQSFNVSTQNAVDDVDRLRKEIGNPYDRPTDFEVIERWLTEHDPTSGYRFSTQNPWSSSEQPASTRNNASTKSDMGPYDSSSTIGNRHSRVESDVKLSEPGKAKDHGIDSCQGEGDDGFERVSIEATDRSQSTHSDDVQEKDMESQSPKKPKENRLVLLASLSLTLVWWLLGIIGICGGLTSHIHPNSANDE